MHFPVNDDVLGLLSILYEIEKKYGATYIAAPHDSTICESHVCHPSFTVFPVFADS